MLGVAGCGGGSDSSSMVTVSGASGASGANGPAPLSKSAFITQADNVCGEANAALDGVSAGTGASDATTQATQELQIVRSEYESLRSLPPPNQGSGTVDQFLSAVKSQVNALTRKKSAAQQGGDTASAQTQFESAKARADNAAGSYGFKDCARAAATTAGAGATTGATTTPTTAVPTTTAPAPAAPAPAAPAPAAPAPPSGGTGGAAGAPSGGGTSGGGTSSGGTGGTGGVSP
jgi:hypothetical protein